MLALALAQNWNGMKLLTYGAVATTVALREAGARASRFLSVAALGVACAAALTLYYLRAFRRTGHLVRMIVQVTCE